MKTTPFLRCLAAALCLQILVPASGEAFTLRSDPYEINYPSPTTGAPTLYVSYVIELSFERCPTSLSGSSSALNTRGLSVPYSCKSGYAAAKAIVTYQHPSVTSTDIKVSLFDYNALVQWSKTNPDGFPSVYNPLDSATVGVLALSSVTGSSASAERNVPLYPPPPAGSPNNWGDAFELWGNAQVKFSAGETVVLPLQSDGTTPSYTYEFSNTGQGRATLIGAYTSAIFPDDPQQKGGPDEQRHTQFSGGNGPGMCSIKMGLPNFWVNTASLNLVVQDTDFSYRGLGPEVSIKRTYNADPAQKGMFGNGWSLVYESRLINYDGYNGTAARVAGGGQGGTFVYASHSTDAPGITKAVFTPPEGNFDQLTAYFNADFSSAYWLYREKDSRHTYRYDPDPSASGSYRLTSISDRNANTVTVGYNADGTIRQITDAVGRVTSFGYNANKRCTAMTTPEGKSTSYSYDASGNMVQNTDLLGTVIAYTYDSANFMTSIAVDGKTTAFGYSESNGVKNVATVTDANGNVTRYAGGDVTDPRGNITSYGSSSGRTTSIRDPLGNSWSKTYSNGLPVSSTDAAGKTAAMEYDANGNLTKHTDALGNVTNYGYDANNNLVSVKNALNQTWTYAYDGNGNLTGSVSPGGKTTAYAYNANRQLLSITNANSRTTSFSYDAFGNIKTATDPLGNIVSYAYDTLGLNRTSVTDPAGNATQFAYDANGRTTKVTNPEGTYRSFGYSACALTSITDEIGNQTALTRDRLLNVTGITDALGNPSSYGFDANNNRTSVGDALNHADAYTYDAANRLTKIQNPLGNSVTLGYDANANLNGVFNERSDFTRMQYDANGRLIAVIDPFQNTVANSRDALGRISILTNARGGTVNFSFDSDGLRSSKSYDNAVVAAYVHDAVGNLTSVDDARGKTTYSYDAGNRVTSIAYPDNKALSFSYDSRGNVSAITYPDSLAVTYSFDSRNRIQSVNWGSNTVGFSYDASGRLLAESRSNGVSSSFTYDANGRYTGIAHTRSATAIANISYSRDAAGRITGETGTPPVMPALINESATLSYDRTGGISSRNSDSYSYDADGNLAAISGSRSFSAVYDPENRPTAVTMNGATTNYLYDGLGNRVSAQTAAGTRNFHHDAAGRLLFETNAAGEVTVAYIYAGPRLIASGTPSGGFVFYHHNNTGNTLALTDSGGTVAAAFAYDPYGNLIGRSGSTQTAFTYVGAYGVMDEGNGLYFMRNRYYDAVTGRFIQRDPIGYAGGFNLYAYVDGNPVSWIDPEGLLNPGNELLKGGYLGQNNTGIDWKQAEQAMMNTFAYVGDKAIGFVPAVGDIYGFGKALYKAGAEGGGWKGGGEGALELVKGYIGNKTNNTVGCVLDLAQDAYEAATKRDLSSDIVNGTKKTVQALPGTTEADKKRRLPGRYM